jgi:prevent-host-death family protein
MGAVRVGAEQLRRQLTDLLNRVGYGGAEIIVERNGKPLAVLRPYVEAEQAPEPLRMENEIERTPALARELEDARVAAGISYEELAHELRVERLRTLREKYPDFAAAFAEELAEDLTKDLGDENTAESA